MEAEDIEPVSLVVKRAVFRDRRVTSANTILPGGAGITIIRDFANSAQIEILDPVDPLITDGPGGMLTDTSLDGGNASSHGYAVEATLPMGALPLFSNGVAGQVVTFAYPHGSGFVIYSTIPLDFYLGGSGVNPPRDNMRLIYAPNILAFAMSLRKTETTLTVDPASGQYGGMTDLSATLLTDDGDPVPGQMVEFSLGGVPVGSDMTDAAGVAMLAGISLGSLGAGSYPGHVTAAFDGTDDFHPSMSAAGLTVTKAPLSVTADDATKLPGAPLPAFTATYSGFVLAEGPAVLAGTLTFTTPATASSPVGTYPVTPDGLTSDNYDITFVPGTLTVTYNICLMYDSTRAANSGSTIPIRLRLCDAAGNNLSSPGIMVRATHVEMLPAMTMWPADDSGNANPGGVFRVTGGGYHFNLQTDKAMPGGSYNLVFTVGDDPVSHTAPFRIR